MSSPPPTPAPTAELTSADQDQLVTLLERCHQLIEPRRRSALIHRLPESIQRKVGHPKGLRAALSELVRVCNDHDGGVAALCRALRWFEGDARPMHAVEAFCASRGVLAPPSSTTQAAPLQHAAPPTSATKPQHTAPTTPAAQPLHAAPAMSATEPLHTAPTTSAAQPQPGITPAPARPGSKTPPAITASGGLRWLHLSDLHAGGPGAALQHEMIDELADEITSMAQRVGPPDLIFFTGDLAYRGVAVEYAQVDDLLGRIHGWLAAAHPGAPAPLLFAVPGNHDLARPQGRRAREYRILRDYDDGDDPGIRELRDELWKQCEAEFIAAMFSDFMAWQRERVIAPLQAAERSLASAPELTLPPGQAHSGGDGAAGAARVCTVYPSFFPGDLSVVIERDGVRLALVGLNSAWLQYCGGDFQGRLHIPLEQFQAALPSDVPSDFFSGQGCTDAFLLMHHPPSWLSPDGLDIFQRVIYKPERFDLCLFGHVHEARSELSVRSGGKPRNYFQAPSLFGLENYQTSAESRRIGYAWGELRADRGLRIWPRRMVPKGSGTERFDRDWEFEYEAGQEWLWLREPDPALAAAAAGTAGTANTTTTATASTAGVVGALSVNTDARSDSQSTLGEPAHVEPDPGDSLPAYAAWAWQQFKHLEMLGLGGGEFELGLDDVHVPLMFSPNVYEHGLRDFGGGHGKRGKLHETAQLGPDALGATGLGMGGKVELHRAFALAGARQHLFIRGEPGSGKTTALKKLLWSSLREADSDADTNTDAGAHGPHFDGRDIGLPRGTVAVFLRLRHLAGPLLACKPADMLDRALIRATATDTAGHAAVPEGFGRWLWQRGHLVLLLDGLDEIARSDDREALCRRLEVLAEAARPRNIRLVVSSRRAGIEEQGAVNLARDRFLHLDVQPLSDDQSAQLVERWYRAAGRARARMRGEAAEVGEKRAADRATELIEAMERHKSAKIKQFVSTPMLLTLLCLLFERGDRIPERRVEFFRACLDTLLDRRIKERIDGSAGRLLSREESLDMLEPVAWALHVDQRKYDLSESELRQLLAEPIRRLQDQGRRTPMVTFQTVRDWLVRVTGVLSEYAPGEYGFMHLNLQEYLAATYAARSVTNPSRDKTPLDTLVAGFDDEWWREVVLLAVALREHNLFTPLMTRVLTHERYLAHAATHIDECLRETYHRDLTPFIDVICDDAQSLARRLAVLRLVRNYADEPLIKAASKIAVTFAVQPNQAAAFEVQQLHALAEHIEANAAVISDVQTEMETDAPSSDSTQTAPPGPVWLLCARDDAPAVRRMARAMSGWGWPVEVCAAGSEPAEQPELIEQLMHAGAVVAIAGPDGRGPWQALASRRALLTLVRRDHPALVVGVLANATSQASPAFLRTSVHASATSTIQGSAGHAETNTAQSEPGARHPRGKDALAVSPLVAKLAALLDVTVPDGVVARSIEATAPQSEPERGTADIAESVGMRFLWLPGGTFTMGSGNDDDMAYGDEKPAHAVTVSGLWMAETPVTNRVYGELLESAKLLEPEFWRDRSYNQPEQPVVGVSWYEAVRFCNALSEVEGLSSCYQLDGDRDAPTVTWKREADGYRLPTEAEWEYACRAGTTTRWWFGDDQDQLADYAWCLDNSDGDLKPVAGKPPNPWGLYDMHGNVWEWCWDQFAEYPNPAPTAPLLDPMGPSEAKAPEVNESAAKSRTLRGGAFGYWAQVLRSAFRDGNAPECRNQGSGFRCVRGGRAQHLNI
ncbi:MAG: hypothetical protein Tsb0020_42420 [Haliangiales bacterium]